MTLAVAAGDTRVTYDPATATLAVSRDGEELLSGRVALAAGDAVHPPVDGEGPGIAETDQTPASVRVVHDDRWATTVELRPGDGHVDVAVSLRNPGDDPVRLGDCRLLAEAAASAFGAGAAVYRNGYQSWTPSATRPVGANPPPETERSAPQMLDGEAPRDTSHGVVGLLPGGDPEAALTLGFCQHDRFLSRFDLDQDAEGVHDLDAVCPGDGAPVAPGDRVALPAMRIDATRPLDEALAGVADAVADRMDARVPEATPTGWCSWYHYFREVTAADVRENLAEIDDWDVPLDVVQVDDGYQPSFGDWRTLAEGFEDMASLTADVDAAGHTPGIWLAPFYVAHDSALAAEHPEWLVTDADGDPADAGPRHGPMYGLDTTHPDALDWLRETVGTMVDDWGFAYLKLDFLYAAALPGERHDPDATRVEAYRTGLRALREAAGEDVTLLGCGAPGFPSVGLVDAMRIGPDTAPHWRAERKSEPAHENAVRNVLNRQWAHRRLWVNDPDCQLVRETTDLTAAERGSFAALVGLLGGSNVLSDRVADVSGGSRHLVERTLPPVATGDVVDVGERVLPRVVRTERPADDAVAVAVFNWGDDPDRLRVDPATHGLSDAHVWDAWAGAYAGTGPVERTVPPHGCLLVHLAPAVGRPRLLGAEHLANLAGQVTDVDWERSGDGGTLTVTLDAERPQSAVCTTPGEWVLDRVATDGGRREPHPYGSVAETTLHPGENRIHFEHE